jgi:hypothetical protein
MPKLGLKSSDKPTNCPALWLQMQPMTPGIDKKGKPQKKPPEGGSSAAREHLDQANG